MAHGLSVRLSGWLAGCGLAEFSISVVAMAGGSEYGEIKQAKHHPRTRIRGDAAPGIMHPSAIRSLAMLASVPYTCIALLLSVIVISEPAARQAGRQPDRQPADTSPTPSLLPAFPEEHLNGTTGSAANCGGFKSTSANIRNARKCEEELLRHNLRISALRLSLLGVLRYSVTADGGVGLG
ncbi:hypothetical protein H113_07609 [Trichophyton rubrum MR1459]|uniref:Uncharacterized protein n=1 Tax=Trichophyton soudanense CBS 452.61 TaxID=1215331 RepID=A0A022XI45_TRISD|nr:hypothetical protein H105_07560 [Trichophyton soudanense CBS 452.61]EZF91536.1 hypothetical protein H113_07609 [Trichophyton rubrum MR1459]EZG02543.1 hypothetical protein H106_07385 [Trichophyton rubrum CBS 735.88]